MFQVLVCARSWRWHALAQGTVWQVLQPVRHALAVPKHDVTVLCDRMVPGALWNILIRTLAGS